MILQSLIAMSLWFVVLFNGREGVGVGKSLGVLIVDDIVICLSSSTNQWQMLYRSYRCI